MGVGAKVIKDRILAFQGVSILNGNRDMISSRTAIHDTYFLMTKLTSLSEGSTVSVTRMFNNTTAAGRWWLKPEITIVHTSKKANNI